MYDHTCISTQALQDLRLATLCGNPYRRSFVHLTKLKTGGCNMVCVLCICKGGGGHWCISRLKIRKICRILVNIWKFNRLSLKPFVCKSCYLQFNSLANGKRGWVSIFMYMYYELAPPPPPMQIKNKFRDVCLRLGFSKPSLVENKHFQIFHTQIQTYEYSRVWINLIPSSTKIESWYFYTPLQWSAANNLPVLDIFSK